MKKTPVQKSKRITKLVTEHKEKVAREKVLALIFTYPYTEFSVTEISEKGDVSKATASKIARDLAKEGIVEIKEGVVWRVRANIQNRAYLGEKITANLASIFRSHLIEFLEELFNHPKAIVIFGSFRKGEDDAGSDIDIAIEVNQLIESQTFYLSEVKYLTREEKESILQLEDFMKRKLSILLFNRNKIDLNLFNNIANGIVLSGFLEVRK